MRNLPVPTTRSVMRRLVWLMACVLAGALVGYLGNAWSGDTAWYLAIPAAVAVGWLFVADPSRCEPAGVAGPPRR